MRPAILQWKVALALVGVVVIAVILGSVLGPSGGPRFGGPSLVTVRHGPFYCVQSRDSHGRWVHSIHPDSGGDVGAEIRPGRCRSSYPSISDLNTTH
jgi:hypothetical protein